MVYDIANGVYLLLRFGQFEENVCIILIQVIHLTRSSRLVCVIFQNYGWWFELTDIYLLTYTWELSRNTTYPSANFSHDQRSEPQSRNHQDGLSVATTGTISAAGYAGYYISSYQQ